jgi:MFS family permease
MGASVTSMVLPVFFYLQAVREMSPTRSALVFAPMAVVTGVLAPMVGRLVDKVHPRYIPTVGFALFATSLVWLSRLMTVDTPIWELLLPAVTMGIASSCIWAPLAATATHNLPLRQAGAGAGVYNTTRQIGSVLGSAGVGALITARMAAHGLGGGVSEGGSSQALPAFLRIPFSSALSESMLLPAAVLVIGLIAVLFFVPSKRADASPDELAVAEASNTVS